MSESILQHLQTQRPAVLLGPTLLLLALYLVAKLIRKVLTLPDPLPKNLPVIGTRPGEWFSLPRARWRVAANMETALREAHTHHRREAVVVPVAGATDHVLLPAHELQWLTEQPDSDINLHEQVLDILLLDYTCPDARLVHPPVHHHVVSTTMTRETGNLVPTLFDELRHVAGELFGAEEEEGWKEITVYQVVRHLIGQVTNRVFVGLPLCRNKTLLETGISFAMDVPVTSTLLRWVWAPFRPLIAPLITLPNRIHAKRFYNILRPEVLRRLALYDARQADPDNKAAAAAEPNDLLQWSVRQARESGDPYLSRPDTLAGRVLLLNLASIHTSSFALTHALLDLAAAGPACVDALLDLAAAGPACVDALLDLAAAGPACVDALRAEIGDTLAAHGGEWNKRAIAAMSRLDSFMRESQRLNSFVVVSIMRKVANPAGITTPSGVHLSKGVMVGAPGFSVMHDGDVYAEPEEFRPFRFSNRRSAATEREGGVSNGNADKKTESAAYIERARQAWATTSPEYTAFGHGRNACPGRFFAAAELKLIMAYLVMHYDIQPQEKRPANMWFGMNRVPPMTATIKMRRRQMGT